MLDRFTDRARKCMSLARQASELLKHDYIGTEHILIGMLKEGSGSACKILQDELNADLSRLKSATEVAAKPGDPGTTIPNQLPFTPGAKKALEFSIDEARMLDHNHVGTEHFLLGLLRQKDGIAAQVLSAHGIELDSARAATRKFLATHGILQNEKVGFVSSSKFPRFDLRGQIALITGAARGLGNACALACANAGADVALGLRDIKSGGALVKEIETMGRRALALQMDMTSMDEIRSGVETAAKHFGRLDILINNAGLGKSDKIEDVKEADFDHTVAINLKGTFFASQAAGRIMIAQKYGRIVNLGSQAGAVALPLESVYCMTKAGIAHLTRCLAVEWGKHNITVNNVAPTFIRTPGTEKELSNAEFRAHVLSMIPLGRIGEPMDVAGTVVFLASPAASLITGTTILVDGGWTAH